MAVDYARPLPPGALALRKLSPGEYPGFADAATAFNGYDRNAYAFTVTHQIGAGTLRALYGNAQDGSCTLVGGGACKTNGLDARQYTLGYSYSLSKRTDLYGFYTRVDNDANATYQFANAAGIGSAAGASNIGYGIGMRHTF